MTRAIEILFALAVLALIATVGRPLGFDWWTADRRVQKTDDAYVQGDLRTLAARVPGYVEQVLVKDFDTVAEGQPILRVESDDYQAKVDLAEGVVQSKEAARDNVTALITQQQNLINQAEAQIEATRANLDLAKVNLERARDLLVQRAGTQLAFDQANATWKATGAQIKANQASVDQAKGQLAVLAAQKKQAEADLAQARASLKLAQIDLEHTTIRAPVAGKLGKRAVFEGQYLAAGTGVIQLTPLDSVWVAANFKETQLAHMRPGQSVTFTVDAHPGVTVRGRVAEIAPASGSATALLPPDNATGNFTKIVQRVPVKIALDPDHALKGQLMPGLSTVVAVDTGGAGERTQPAPSLLSWWRKGVGDGGSASAATAVHSKAEP